MKYLLFYFLIFISFACSNDPDLTVDCSYEEVGTSEYSLNNPDFKFVLPHIISPDLDSIFQFCFAISSSTISSLDDIVSLELSVYDENGKTIFVTKDFMKFHYIYSDYAIFHLWDLEVDSEKIFGEIFFDLDIQVKNEQSIVCKNHNVMSISCDQIAYCWENADECDFTGCRWFSDVLLTTLDPWGKPFYWEDCI